MDKKNRFSIGIIFNFSKSWLGGFYYYQNIIKALDFLPDEEKPEIIIFYNRHYSEYLDEIQYPYLRLIPRDFPSIYKGYLLSVLRQRNVFIGDMIRDYDLQGIYPVNDSPVHARKSIPRNVIGAAWFPDLQHKFFPEFFDRKRLWLRELRLKITLKNTTDLVVSSGDTANHFKRFYKIPTGLKIHVLQFVSILDVDIINQEDFGKIKQDYDIPDNYFVVSNGFLKHKNHLVVLKAIAVLKQQQSPVNIIFTGKMEAYADSTYINELKSFIRENHLEENVRLLGIIPRAHQLCIMKNSRAVLQPSMFEGWNTTIEDAKSLQVPVIASGIAVHREQLEDKGYYFDQGDERELAHLLLHFNADRSRYLYTDYNQRVKTFARSFLNIFYKTVSVEQSQPAG